jgi:hypothetical protein
MARDRKKLSMYEVMGKGQLKAGYSKTLKKPQPEKADSDAQAPSETPLPTAGRATYWPRKPKLVQFNAGRIEISLPYPIAIAVLLGIILLFLVALWLGEVGYFSREGISPGSVFNNLGGEGLTGRREGTGVEERIISDKITETDKSGDNRIVIQTYNKRADLELVQYHFAEGGIDTEIRKIGNTFYLVSADKYEKDPKIEGTDGYAALQRIIKWGARYKAPQGYEPFGVKSFETAHGKKFDD